MEDTNSAVAELLRSATDDLDAPSQRLVAGAVARGRSRRRRHLASTTIAAAAVIGAAAIGGPQLVGGGGSRSGDVELVPAGPVAQEGPRTIVPAAQGASTLVSLLPDGESSGAANDEASKDTVASRVVYEGGVVEAEVFEFHSAADKAKAAELGHPLETTAQACGWKDHTECVKLPDGTWFDHATTGYREPGQQRFLGTRATAWTPDGFVVRVTAYNVSGDQKNPVIVPGGQPVLTVEELQAIVTSDAWFR